MQKDRNILKLNSNKKKVNDPFNMSAGSMELLEVRRKQLKEEQKKKELEKKATIAAEKAQREEKIEKNKAVENKVSENVKNYEDAKNAADTGRTPDNTKKRQDRKKDGKNKWDNKKNFSDKKKEQQKKLEEQKKQNEKREQEEKKQQEEQRQHFKAQNKKTYSKNDKDYNDDEQSQGKRFVKDRTEKYSKNIHTYIFNDDDSDKNVHQNLSRNKKKTKKNDGGDKQSTQKIYQTVNIPEFITISDLADRMNEKKVDIVKKLFSMGIKATINQTIDGDTAELIVMEFGHKPNRVSDSDIEKVLENNEGNNFVSRSPVVTVMGHVDHGKTSLLDALRTTKVAEGESGGITQHIGASRVEVNDGKFITFIDTPGHEAFTEMRIRGANITDIVVLVVAADDGVKTQTIEAINHTKAAKVPMIVAVNKIDKEGSEPEKVKQELLQYDVIAEDYGGDVMFVNVSAKSRIGLDKLLETILLQAEMLDLKAPIDCKAVGAVIESKMDVQKGVVATVLVQKGILKIGDIVLVGTSYGRVKKMIDDKRRSHSEVYPSMAVEILGLDTTPNAGDIFNVVNTEKEARDIISYRERKERDKKGLMMANKTAEGMLQQVKGSNKKVLPIILKCDVSGSIEAIEGSLKKLDNEEVSVDIIHSAVGYITVSDINLASASNAIIIAFNVRATNLVKELAKEKSVEIRYYSIIYNIVDEVKSIMSGLLQPTTRENTIGEAEVRNVFKIGGVGKIAGCYVTSGEIRRNCGIKLIRDGIVIFDGKIKTLKRFKDDVKEVKNNYECGIAIENYDDIKEKDVIECYEVIEEKRSL